MPIQSNIKGLGQVLTKLDDRLKKLETARPIRVIGGLNIRTTNTGKDWIVNADPAGDSAPAAVSRTCPLDILLQKPEGSDEWAVSVRLGTVGGYAPDNWHHIDTTDGKDTRFLVAKITALEKNIQTVTLQLREEADGCIQTESGNPPANFEILIGALIAKPPPDDPEAPQPAPTIVRAISCGSITLKPLMVGDDCWTWNVGVA